MSSAVPKTKDDEHLSSTAEVGTTTTTQKTENEEGSFNNYHCGLIALVILILLSNFFAIQLYKKHDKIRRNFSNILLLSLAISDLIVGVIVLPLLIVCETKYSQTKTNTALKNTCRCNFLIANLSGFSTICHIIALTVEKYMAILHPFQRLNLATLDTYKKILITVWLTALLFAAVPALWMFTGDGPRSSSGREHLFQYGILQIVVFFAVPVIILTFCYLRMFVKIHAKFSENSQNERIQTRVGNDSKTIVVFLLLFVIFLVSWFPWFFIALRPPDHLIPSPEVADFLTALRFAGAFVNPLVYAFLKTDYKQAIKGDLSNFCSRYPKRMRFQSMAHQSVFKKSINNNDRSTAITTPDTGIRLQKIQMHYQNRPPAGSLTSGSPSTQGEEITF